MPVMLEVEHCRGETQLLPQGKWRLSRLPEVIREMESRSFDLRGAVTIDGRGLQEIDTSGALMLFRFLERAGADKDKLRFTNIGDEQMSIIALVAERLTEPGEIGSLRQMSLVVRIGFNAVLLARTVGSILSFLGQLIVEMCLSLVRPRLIRVRELFVQLEQTLINAVPIVSLVTFLIGVVLAYLFGVYMKQYGANIFIVDAMGMAMCREISPILVAIIVAGRSGSAFTAQIGTMKLNEEIDAMRTLGLSPVRVLILPRLFALMLAMPLLTFVGDVVGLIGGMVIADLHLNITGVTFVTRLRAVLSLKSFFVGLAKAPVFAFFIAGIGCRMGLAVENNARSVGENTTATVVRSVVSVILLNAAFAVLFAELGI